MVDYISQKSLEAIAYPYDYLIKFSKNDPILL